MKNAREVHNTAIVSSRLFYAVLAMWLSVNSIGTEESTQSPMHFTASKQLSSIFKTRAFGGQIVWPLQYDPHPTPKMFARNGVTAKGV